MQQLREELEKAKHRMQVWKEKTQVGVTELRNRIIELTTELEESRAANDQLSQQLQNAKSVATAAASTSGAVPECSSFAESHYFSHVGAWVTASSDALVEILLDKSDAALDIAVGTWRELEKHKRRTAQTLRMQKKTTEALEQELAGLRETLTGAQAELVERKSAIERRDQALETLQNRLETLEEAKASFEASQAAMASRPNAEQINAFEERLEEERENMRHEFTVRESIIFDQHRDEMERLMSRYEQDMAELRAELEERALETAETGNKHLGEGAQARGQSEQRDDAAYGELLDHLKSLQEELRGAQEENQKLTQELAAVKRTHSGVGGPVLGSCSVKDFNGQNKPSTLPEALSRIAELEGDVSRLSDELCATRRRLVATRHQSNTTKDQENSLVFDGQLATYLRFTVVQLLCSSGDTNVAKNLFPVLTTLLRFDKSNLSEIYKKNPGWVKRRF